MTKRVDGLLLLAAAAGLAIFVRLYASAFPTAAIDLELSRAAVKDRADGYLRRQGVEPDTFLSTLTFGVRGSAAVFLQRVRGLEETSRFAREVLPLWSWEARWFRSGEKEEFGLDVGPDGAVLEFHHAIPEAAPGDSLSPDSARAVATAFVTQDLGVDLEEWRLVDEATTAREERVDHTFTWERTGSEIEWRPEDPEAGTGSLRLSVDVTGAEIGGFARFLKIPEKFLRQQRKEESVGSLLALASGGLTILLVIAALVVAIARHKTGEVRWRPWLLVGGIVTATVLATGVLSYPLLKAQYPTDLAFPTFVGIALVAGFLGSLLYGLAIWVTAASGESLARETLPTGLRALGDWAAKRWFTPAAAAEILRGYAVGLAFVGYITGFYVLGRKFLGVWLPADSPHSELLSMYLPWLVPVLIGVQASVSEEFLFRMFGVSFFKRHLKITFLALLIPAMIWALGHSNYPVFPVYVRGIELTIAGCVFGWVFIRYGLLSMLVAHYAIDVILLAMPLLRSSGGTYVGYGLLALGFAALPLLVPVLVWLRRRESAAADAGARRL